MSGLAPFSTPAFIDDLSDSAKRAWSDIVHGWFKEAEARLPPGHRLFNIADEDASQAVAALIPWEGFPRKVKLLFPTDLDRRWSFAENVVGRDLFNRGAGFYLLDAAGNPTSAALPFRDQDEYCEWHVYKDATSGKPRRIVFTSENPEYWTHIAETDEDKLVSLYRDLVNPAVQRDDLFFASDVFVPLVDENGNVVSWDNRKGRYNPLNRWNTTDGIVHLTHPANSLSAEVFLAADATILRLDATGSPVTDQAALICCAAYGGMNRSSDPAIGGRINELVRSGLAISIADPVGLYMGDIDPLPIEMPGGIAFQDCWKVKRGDAASRMVLNAEFSLPEGSGFELSDILVGGEPLRYGGQLAELITIVIHGIGLPRNDQAPADNCQAGCCRYSNVPALQFFGSARGACPTRDLELPENPGQTLGETARKAVSIESIPDPRMR
jgi:hypothetical protein